MYRQQDSLRNDAAIKVEEFPPHIKVKLHLNHEAARVTNFFF